MKVSIAYKIFGIAVVVLAMMIAVAIFSIRYTAEISRELDLVARKQLPLSETIGELNVRILEQGILLQQLFAASKGAPNSIARLNAIEKEIADGFAKAQELFKIQDKTGQLEVTYAPLRESLGRVMKQYFAYEQHGKELLLLHEAGDAVRFDTLLPEFRELQNTVDREIFELRHHVERVADDAVKRADESEKALLWFNVVMTSLAAILAMVTAGLVTHFLVRNLRNLVGAAETVGAGDLDAEVPILTRDEVGRLGSTFNQMVSDLRTKERIKDTFGKYMDPRIVARLIENPEFTRLGGERKEMTVMFIDLHGYTTISEKLPPDDLVNMLNLFLGQMTHAVTENNGVINDFLGDALMAYWGPPFNEPHEHASLACRAALLALRNFEDFKRDLSDTLGTRVAKLEVDMRIGISTGSMISGNIGSATSRKFSVVGDPVNLGARLEGANKNYGTRAMISEETRQQISNDISVRELDLVRVKGKEAPTRIYELRADDLDAALFEGALAAYRKQQWDQAEQDFRKFLENHPDDPTAQIFLSRIAHFRSSPPRQDWDGVWNFETK